MITEIVVAAAKAASISPSLLLAICSIESNLRPEAINQHDGGSPSIGVCQLKVDTALMFDRFATAKKLLDPRYNAKLAARYVRYQSNRYISDECIIAAYNAGTCLRNKRGLIRNRQYVAKVQKRKAFYEASHSY
jgi:soluble lytic murein transglycosylase-like protein